VIRSFDDRRTEDIYNGVDSRAARRACLNSLWPVVQRKFDYLDAAVPLESLRAPPANQLEALKGDRNGQHSIRIGSASSGHQMVRIT
jgi:toxin HigB-1